MSTGTHVIIDDLFSATAAYIEEGHWNGFALPWFTEEQGKALIPQLDAAIAENGEDAADKLTWDAERGVFVLSPYWDEPYDVRTIERDGVTLHGIGTGAWTWQLAGES